MIPFSTNAGIDDLATSTCLALGPVGNSLHLCDVALLDVAEVESVEQYTLGEVVVGSSRPSWLDERGADSHYPGQAGSSEKGYFPSRCWHDRTPKTMSTAALDNEHKMLQIAVFRDSSGEHPHSPRSVDTGLADEWDMAENEYSSGGVEDTSSDGAVFFESH
mmetsp:Transcript_4291/g.9051  ORF Transcript_4291/g.9051 Transcript_4291/m.9051 type:complete len:162 (+) Transcript_4291:454-939(+)